MRIFISGGCKNGKSTYAQTLAKKMQKPEHALYYLATMIPHDHEDDARILRHQCDREGWGFETVEVVEDILASTSGCDKQGAFLLDSLTALLANAMFPKDSEIKMNAYLSVASDTLKFLEQTEDVVIVSDYIYSDAALYDELTEKYRAGLAFVDKQVAQRCDVVIEACYGTFIVHKGNDIMEERFYEVH